MEKSLRILIDLSYILNENDLNKSTAIYVQRFLDNLSIDKQNFILFVRESTYNYFSTKYGKQIRQILIFQESKLINISFIKSLVDAHLWQKQVNSIDCDVVYIPFTWIYNSLKVNKPKVTTIHDLRPLRETQIKRFRSIVLGLFRYYFRKAADNADLVITISEFVKEDVLDSLKTKTSVEVVHNGIPIGTPQHGISELAGKKYILYVNTLTEYKNVRTLLQAFALLKRNDLYLAIVGKETDFWRVACSPLLNDKIVHLKFVSDAELVWLYCNALLFVTPSTKEGFGYTPAEAGMYGCPIISTKCEALPETTLHEAYYYENPFDENELAEKIDDVLSDNNETNRMALAEKIKKDFRTEYDVHHFSTHIMNAITSVGTK